MSRERGFLSSEPPKTMMMKKMNYYPTRKKSSKSQSTTISSSPSSDLLPITSSSLKKQPSYLKWVPNHKAAQSPKPTSHSLKPSSDPPGPPPPPLPAPRVDTHLQDKVLTLSADVDSYRSSLIKKTHYQKQEPTTTTIKNHHFITEMERNKKGSKEMKEKVKLPRVKGGEEEKRKSVSLVNSGGGGGGGRRKSCGSSEIELSDFFSKVGVRVMAVDMPPFMQIHAVSCAREVHDSLDKFTSKSLALTLKKEFDGVYGPAWHCIVGTSFGSFVTHSVGGFLYFSMDPKLYILLFKTAVQKAD